MSDSTSSWSGWSDRLSDLANNPAFNGLLGMTAGFAQAAMPSRLPVPFGAALGLAAQGFGAGAKNAYASQLAKEQAESAKIANQRANLLFNYFGNQFGGGTGGSGTSVAGGTGASATPNGTTLASTGSGSGGAPMGAAPGGGSPNYLLTPGTMKSLGDLAMMTGNDRAAATLYNMIGSTAGGAGYGMSPGGTSFAVPGGPHDPAVITRNTVASEVPKAAIDVKKAWEMLGPEAQKAAIAANSELWRKYNTPGELPGGGYGTPAQLMGGSPQMGGPPGVAPSGGRPVATADPFPTIAQRIVSNENGTGNPAAANPNSTATGNGQFIAGTWPGVLRATRPDLTAGRSDQDLLALRGNPELSLAATDQYARQNGAALAQAGFPVTPGTIYMAHGLGPQGAMSVLRATPQTPVAAILPQNVIAANPYLQGKTAGDVRTYFDQKMSGIDAGQPHNVSPGVTQRTAPNGVIQTTNTLPVQTKLFERDMQDLDKATEDATHIQQSMTRLYDMRDLAKQLTQSGFGGESRAAISNFVDTYIKPIPGMGNAVKGFLDSVGNLPDAQLAQEFAKLNLQAAGMQERDAVGARGGYRLTELYKQANPSIGLQPGANLDIANLQLVAHQMDLDYLRGLHDHVTSNGQQFANGQANYVPAAEYDKQWIKADNPKIYLAATYALNGKSFADWTKMIGNDQDKIRTAIDIVRRVDPNAQIMWQDGKPHVFAQQGG